MTGQQRFRPIPDRLTKRAALSAIRRVDAMFSARGPAFRQLAMSWAANVAGDTLVAIALAGTLFFDVPNTAEARSNVALYLAITMAPFAIVAPLLGGLFSRFPVYRGVITFSCVARGVFALIMMTGLDTIWLFPLAFTMLVLSRLYGISKSSMMPVAIDEPTALVSANARLARIGIYAGAVVLPLGVAVSQIGPELALLLSAGFFLFSGFLSLGLPDPRTAEVAAGLAHDQQTIPVARASMRSLRISRLATAGVRFINGYLILLLAFAFQASTQRALDFGALVAAAGAGYGLASYLAPWLEKHLREEPMVVAALAVEAGAAFLAAQGLSLAAAAAVAGAAGIAWGVAKFGFDGLLQRSVPPGKRGGAFTRAETLFQLAWVVGAIIPVLVRIDPELGMTIAGIAALTAQTIFVAGLLVDGPDGGT
ncbi:MAG: hypothetical protein KJ698_11640 [Actinobacteria bacterium]|nr:hypothetical protein [Actinomycetota bacterium]MBU1494682.1 hypothetical protein [Actinomycetota bacterium]MBU1865054.1 hypothetical protein [Actinomycetota bacterium]